MNKFIAAALAVFMAFAAHAADEKKNPLPTFSTFYTFATYNYRNDISLTAVENPQGELKGVFNMKASNCKYENVPVVAVDEGEYYIIRLTGLPGVKPEKDEYCASVLVVIKLPKKKGAFGYYAGVLEATGQGRRTDLATFTYKD